MRKFGESKIEYFEFQFEGSEETYRIPLAAYMPYKLLNEMREASESDEGFPAQVNMLRRYMGDIVDELSYGTLSEIIVAWGQASSGAGASVGES